MIRRAIGLALALCALASHGALCDSREPDAPVGDPVGRKLRAPLTSPAHIRVDGFGRFYIYDPGREALMRFGLSGQLEKLWPTDSRSGSAETMPRYLSLSVNSAGTAILGAMAAESLYPVIVRPEDSRILFDTDTTKIDGNTYIEEIRVAMLDDGSYYTNALPAYMGGKIPSYMIRFYGADGKLKKSWPVGVFREIAPGPDGSVYCSISGKKEIQVFDQNGTLKRTIDCSDMSRTDYIGSFSVDSNGDIYINDLGEVSRGDANGRLIKRWSCGASSARSIAVRKGLVYVLTCYNEKRFDVQLFTPNGECIARYRPERPELNMPRHVTPTKGNYYAVQSSTNEWVFHDPAGSRMAVWPGEPFVGDMISACAVPDGGYMAVLRPPHEGGASMSGIGTLDANGGLTKLVAKWQEWSGDNPSKVGKGLGRMVRDPKTGNLWGMGVGWDGTNAGIAVEIDPSGALIRTWPWSAGFSFVSCVDPEGFIYVVNGDKWMVQKRDFEGKLVAGWGREGRAPGEFWMPTEACVDSSGNLIVCDSGNSRLQVYSREGTFLGIFGKRGNGRWEFDRPRGVSLGPDGDIWVADTHNDRIVRVPKDTFWNLLSKEIVPEPQAKPLAQTPEPAAGLVTVAAVVVAGSSDLDSVFVESTDRAWGMRVSMPAGQTVERGKLCRLTGTVTVESDGKRLAAQSIELVSGDTASVEPLGMANLYIGAGHASRPQLGPSNMNMLVRTWGRVTAIDPANGVVTISDGSETGLIVDLGRAKRPIAAWPKVGDFLSVTGISTESRTDKPAGVSITIRDSADVMVLRGE